MAEEMNSVRKLRVMEQCDRQRELNIKAIESLGFPSVGKDTRVAELERDLAIVISQRDQTNNTLKRRRYAWCVQQDAYEKGFKARNEIIKELEKELRDAQKVSAERDEAADWVEAHGGIDELDKRLMPEGMEWPRFDDGEKITWNNSPDHTAAICLALDGSCYSLHYDMPDDERMCIYEASERVKRPVTEVLGADGNPIKVGETVYHDGGMFEVQVVREGAASDEFGEWYDSGLLTHTQPDTQKRIKAIESELAETKKQLAEEKANADGHWKNANNWAKQLEEARIENHNLKGVLAEFNFKLKLFLGTYAARFDENGMPKNIDKEPPSLLDLMGILKDGQKEEES